MNLNFYYTVKTNVTNDNQAESKVHLVSNIGMQKMSWRFSLFQAFILKSTKADQASRALDGLCSFTPVNCRVT